MKFRYDTIYTRLSATSNYAARKQYPFVLIRLSSLNKSDSANSHSGKMAHRFGNSSCRFLFCLHRYFCCFDLQTVRVNSHLLLFKRNQSNVSPKESCKRSDIIEGDPEMMWRKSSFAVGPELQIGIRGSSLRRGLFFDDCLHSRALRRDFIQAALILEGARQAKRCNWLEKTVPKGRLDLRTLRCALSTMAGRLTRKTGKCLTFAAFSRPRTTE
jgi:hypothetical protein